MDSVRITYPLPDFPPEEWSDIRAEFEKTHSMLQVSRVFMCDPRTIGRCLRLNLSSTDIGCQVTPKKVDSFRDEIHRRFDEICSAASDRKPHPGICQISREITAGLKAKGYTGSERTVRNYIRQCCLRTKKAEA